MVKYTSGVRVVNSNAAGERVAREMAGINFDYSQPIPSIAKSSMQSGPATPLCEENWNT